MTRYALWLLVMLFPSWVVAEQCNVIFEDGINTHGSGQVFFGWNAQLVNSPDGIINASSVSTNNGSSLLSCESQHCVQSPGGPISPNDMGAFQSGTSNTDITIDSGETITIGDSNDNDYDRVTVRANGTLNFSTTQSEYFIDRLTVNTGGRVTLVGV